MFGTQVEQNILMHSMFDDAPRFHEAQVVLGQSTRGLFKSIHANMEQMDRNSKTFADPH